MDKQDKNKNTQVEEVEIAYRVLVEPWVTESSTAMMELNKYVFKVAPRATKREIEKAVKELYKVEVLSVNTINVPSKFRMQGRTQGWKSGFKKAVVTIKEGDKIDFFEGK